jgi:hypothetical protein
MTRLDKQASFAKFFLPITGYQYLNGFSFASKQVKARVSKDLQKHRTNINKLAFKVF